MSPAIAYIAAAALGIAIGLIAFPGHGRLRPCFHLALVGLWFAGLMDMHRRGDEAYLATVLNPLEQILGLLIGYQGDGYSQSVNPCPPERNPGQYGGSVRYDGILITGSPEFVSKTITALNRLYDTKSYRFAKALRSINERDLSWDRWAQVNMETADASISPRAAARSCTFLAGSIVHEGAHIVYGPGHGPVYAAQARALEEMGEPQAASATLRMARNY